MRHALLFVLFAACGSSSDSSGPSAPPDDHKLHDLSSESNDGSRIAWAGKEVPLADIRAIADRIGLPLSGTADVSIYLDVSKPQGARDYSKAKGTIAISCTKCQIGDGTAKLAIGGNKRTQAFVGDGLDVGSLMIDSLEAKAIVGDGKLELSVWKLASADLEVQLALAADIAKTGLRQSDVKACLRFKPTKALEQRSPKTYALLSMTGGSLGEDGFYSIEISGRAGELKRFSRKCTVPAR